MLSGYPAMHCDYVVPGRPVEPDPADEAALPFAPPAGEPSAPGHCRPGWSTPGATTYQLTFSVNPPGDLARNRAVAEDVVHTCRSAPDARRATARGELRVCMSAELRRQPIHYEDVGAAYGRTRQPDPRIARRIRAALGDARTVVNVGAGLG